MNVLMMEALSMVGKNSPMDKRFRIKLSKLSRRYSVCQSELLVRAEPMRGFMHGGRFFTLMLPGDTVKLNFCKP